MYYVNLREDIGRARGRRVEGSPENDASSAATRKSLLLVMKSKMLTRKSLFLTSKSQMLARKSLFLTSKSECLEHTAAGAKREPDRAKPR